MTQAVVQTVLHLGLRRGDAEQVEPTVGRVLERSPRSLREYVGASTGVRTDPKGIV